MKNVKILGATLLSKEEAETLLTQEEREYFESNGGWWLRSPGDDFYFTCYVYIDGYVTSYYYTYRTDVSVRPALKIDISNSDIELGDTFTFGGKEFKILTPELAWMYNDDIGKCAFREDWEALNANMYEASDVKKFVDAWFTKVLKEE